MKTLTDDDIDLYDDAFITLRRIARQPVTSKRLSVRARLANDAAFQDDEARRAAPR